MWWLLKRGEKNTLIPKLESIDAAHQTADQVYIGLAVTSHAGPRVRATAKISHVRVAGNVTPTGPFTISQDIGLWLSRAASPHNFYFIFPKNYGPKPIQMAHELIEGEKRVDWRKTARIMWIPSCIETYFVEEGDMK